MQAVGLANDPETPGFRRNVTRQFVPKADQPPTTPQGCSPPRAGLGVQVYLASLIDRRLLFELSHRPDVRGPWLRRARPYLHTWGDLVALTYGAHANGVDFGPVTSGRRVNWRSTLWAKRLRPLIPTFAGFDVDFQLAREQFERVFSRVRVHAERGSR